MKDGIIKGTGNSRYLKSSISASTTLAQLITMLRNGTFPVDFNGINENGWQQLGTALNKANLLSDSTKNSIGLTQSDPTIDNALSKLRSLITTAQNTASGRAQIQMGSYTGTGTYGASNPNTLTFGFAPKAIHIFKKQYTDITGGTYNRLSSWVAMSELTTSFAVNKGFMEDSNGYYGKKSSDGKTVSWYSGGNAYNQCNFSGEKYWWIAFG